MKKDHSAWRLVTVLLIGSLTLSACSMLSKRVEVRTDPIGAEIHSMGGEKIGVTPLELSSEKIAKLTEGDKLAIILDAPGYVPRQVLLDVHGEDIIEVKLTPLDSQYFSNRLLKDYGERANQMVRSLLGIQGMVMVKKLDEAERSLEGFQKDYPNIAATYALLANIEMMRGNSAKARGYLLRGQSIDPADPAIQRALGTERKAGGR